MKVERIVNKSLLQTYTTSDCAACGKSPCYPMHIYPVKNGGPDLDYNLVPLCKTHRDLLRNYGWVYFLELNNNLAIYLRRKGWVFNERGFKNLQ